MINYSEHSSHRFCFSHRAPKTRCEAGGSHSPLYVTFFCSGKMPACALGFKSTQMFPSSCFVCFFSASNTAHSPKATPHYFPQLNERVSCSTGSRSESAPWRQRGEREQKAPSSSKIFILCYFCCAPACRFYCRLSCLLPRKKGQAGWNPLLTGRFDTGE